MSDLELNLKQLHLPTVNAHYKEFADEARREDLSYEEYLDGLMGREIEHRRETLHRPVATRFPPGIGEEP